MKTISCIICESNQHRFLFEGRDRVFGIPGTFKIVKCEECGLIFINPQPEKERLKEFYPKEYYQPKHSQYKEYSLLRKKVLETYWGYRHHSNLSKGIILLNRIIWVPFRIRYRHSIPFVEGGRLLDIGCGNGTELYKLRALGWETYGVEIDAEASERARMKDLSVFTGDLFEANYPDQFFHVVRMSFVLEHLPNPKETLLEVKRILKQGGRVYLSIQNARSLNYWLFGRWWFCLDVPRHLFSFTPKTIWRLLSSLGFEVRKIWFDSGERNFLVSLQYWMNDRYGRTAALYSPQTIVRNRFLKVLTTPFCYFLDRIGLGDLMHLEVTTI